MGAIRDFLDSVGRTKTGYAGTNIPGPPPVAPPDLTPTQITDALRDVLKKNIGFGGGDGTFSSTGTSKAGSAQTDAEKYAADKAAFDETLRKYQLDRRAYEQYQGDVNARLRSFNPYADSQFRIMPTNTGAPVPTPTAPAAPTKLNAPTYGAIPITMSTPTDQGAAYKQMRDFGYTDADIRSATSKITGSPTDQKWADILSAGYSQYAPAVQGAYQQLGRSGFGGGAEQIDTPGYSYWLNQLSSGAVRPEDLNQAVLTAGRPSNLNEIQNIYQQYFNRTPDPSGTQYWGQSGLTGDALKNAIIGGAQGPDLAYYQQNFGGGTQQPINQVPDPYYAGGPGEGGGAARGGYISKYAGGGRVRTHYQTGGETPRRRSPAASPVMPITDPGYLDQVLSRPVGAEPPEGFSILNPNMGYGQMYPPTSPRSPAALDPNMDYGQMYPSTSPRSPAALALMPIEGVGEGAEIIGDAPRQRLEGLMAVEGTGEGMPITPSGQRAPPTENRRRNPTLEELLARQTRESPYASEIREARGRTQSEAAAFADLIQRMSERGESPTSRAEMYFRLAAAFGAPTRTGSIGETLSGVGRQMGEYTQGRRAEESERRALAMRAGEARLGASRQDLQTLLALSKQESDERRAASADLLAQANLAINQARLGIEQARRGELAPDERRAVREGRARVNASESALKTLEEALSLNPNTYDRSFGESTQRFLAENLSPRHPTVLATRQQENLLGQEVIEKLRASFGGNPTEGERNFLRELSGINARSREERAAIIQRGIARLRDRIKDEAEEIQFITSGRSREITQ